MLLISKQELTHNTGSATAAGLTTVSEATAHEETGSHSVPLVQNTCHVKS